MLQQWKEHFWKTAFETALSAIIQYRRAGTEGAEPC